MINITERLNEQLITEAACKNLDAPRKGSTLYMMEKGAKDNKAVAVQVTDVKKVKTPYYGQGGYDLHIYLGENPWGIECWTKCHFSDPDLYKDPRLAEVTMFSIDNGRGKGKQKNVTIYIGCTKTDIQAFINSHGSKQSEGLAEEIAELESQLADLKAKKEQADAEANMEITESYDND